MNIESEENIEEIKKTLKIENRTNPLLVDYYGDGKNVSVMHVAAKLSDNKAQYTKIDWNKTSNQEFRFFSTHSMLSGF